MDHVPPPTSLFTSVQHVTTSLRAYLSHFLASLARMASMASPADSMAPLDFAPHSKRRMLHLKTKEECRLGNETIQVWTVELPSKHAEGILRVAKREVQDQDAIDLQHLRRFAKPKFLPPHIVGRPNKVKEMYMIPRAWDTTAWAVSQAPSTSTWEYSTPLKSRVSNRPQTLHLLICPTKFIAAKDLYALLLEHPPFCSSADSWAYPLEIKEVTVPLLAPTSQEQALEWSKEYWPTFYRKTNPFGAHPATIQKAEDNLQGPPPGVMGVEEAMRLAETVGRETQNRGYGIGPGCVILERVDNTTQVVAVAGDARSKPVAPATTNQTVVAGGCEGSNVMGHAVMRAIGMIGRKRLRVASQRISTKAAKAERNFTTCGLGHDEEARDAFFLDLPLTPLEEKYFTEHNLVPDGYLCLQLEIFLTHEPCIMCSMALVHSRVGRVIFLHRMPQTGGLTAELARNDTGPVGLGYGMCWRKELNWQFMCWEYTEQKHKGTGNVEHAHIEDGMKSLAITDDDNVRQEEGQDNPEGVATFYDDYANVSSSASTHV